MKTRIISSVVTALFLTPCFVFGQFSVISGPESINPCGSGNYQFTLTNNTGSMANTVDINLDVNQNVVIDPTSVTINGSPVTPVSEHITYSNLASGATLDINYQLSAEQISCPQPIVHEVSTNLSGILNQTRQISFTSPLVFYPSLSTNLDNYSASIGTSFNRSFVFRNTDPNTDFTGVLKFTDLYRTGTPAVSISSVFTVTTNVAGVTPSITGTPTINALGVVEILISVPFPGLPESFDIGGGTMVDAKLTVTEIVTLNDCNPDPDPDGQTEMIATFGCDVSHICYPVQIENTDGDNKTETRELHGGPVAVVTHPTHEVLPACQESSFTRTVLFSNSGASSDGFIIEIHMKGISEANTKRLSHIDGSSINLFLGSTLLIPGTDYAINSIEYDENNPHPAGYLPELNYLLTSNMSIGGTDVLRLEYTIETDCVDPLQYDDYFNKELVYHGSFTYFTLTHPCNPARNDEFAAAVYAGMHFGQSFNNLNALLSSEEIGHYEIVNSQNLDIETLNGLTVHPLSESAIEFRIYVQNGLELVLDAANIPIFEMKAILGTGLYPSSNFDFSYLDNTGLPDPNSLTPSSTSIAQGTGGWLVARFDFAEDPLLWTPFLGNVDNRPYVDQLSDRFYQFFNNFKIKFDLRANCDEVSSDGNVAIVEEFFFVPTTGASCGDCKLPLAKVESMTHVNCPGCITPGWNISSFNLEREDYGFVDADNDFLPDNDPGNVIDPNDPVESNGVNLKNVMLGDIIRMRITADLNGGDENHNNGSGDNNTQDGLSMNLTDFDDFTEGQFYIQALGFPMTHLLFLDAELVYNRNGVNITNTSISIPSGAAHLSLDNQYISVDLSAILSTVPSPNFTFQHYVAGDIMTITPRFQVIQNLTGTTGNSGAYFDIYELNAAMMISPNPYNPNPYLNADYANAGDFDDLVALNVAERSALSYWCTQGFARFGGVGFDSPNSESYAFNLPYWGSPFINLDRYQFTTNGINLTDEVITYERFAGVGKAGQNTLSFGSPDIQAVTSFTNEIREIAILDELTFDIPAGYRCKKILFEISNPLYDNNSHAVVWDNNLMRIRNSLPNEALYYHEYVPGAGEPAWTVGPTQITIHPDNALNRALAPDPAGPIYDHNGGGTYSGDTYYWANEENKKYRVYCILELDNCTVQQAGVSPSYDGKQVHAKYRRWPTAGGFVTYHDYVTVLNDGNDAFRNIHPSYNLHTNSSSLDAGGVVTWDLDLSMYDPLDVTDENPIAPADIPFADKIRRYERATENTFLYFAPSTLIGGSGGFTISNYQTLRGATPVTSGEVIFDQIDNEGEIVAPYIFPYTSSNDAFGFGYVGLYDATPTQQTKSFTVNAQMDCQSLPDFPTGDVTEFVDVTIGWGRDDYPTGSITPCQTTTKQLQITIPFVDLQVDQTAPFLPATSILACSDVPFDFDLSTIGVGDLGTVSISLSSAGDAYVLPQASLTIPDATNPGPFAISPVGGTYDLSAYRNDLSNSPFTFSFDLAAGCSNTPLNIHFYAENSCGNLIMDESYNWTPDIVSPEIISFVQVGACAEGSATFNVTINNPSALALSIDVSVNSTLQTSLTIPANSNAVYPLTFPVNMSGNNPITIEWNYCDCDPFTYDFDCSTGPCNLDASFTADDICASSILTATPAVSSGSHSWLLVDSDGLNPLTSNSTVGTFSSLAPGTYYITHTYIPLDPCPQDPITSGPTAVEVFDLNPIISYTGSSTLCTGDVGILTVTNASAFGSLNWTGTTIGGTTVSSSGSVLNITAGGTYTVNSTSKNCPNSSISITIDGIDPPVRSTDIQTFCQATTNITLNAGTGYDSYLWSTGDVGSFIVVDFDGSTTETYVANVCTAPGCCADLTFIVQGENLNPVIGEQYICDGLPVEVSSPVTTPGSTYQWYQGVSPYGTGESINITSGGNYSLDLTSVNGCHYIVPFHVTASTIENGHITPHKIANQCHYSFFADQFTATNLSFSWEILNGTNSLLANTTLSADGKTIYLNRHPGDPIQILTVILTVTDGHCTKVFYLNNYEVKRCVETCHIKVTNNNTELCEGESTAMHIANANQYAQITWTLDGAPYGSGSAITATATGTYTATAVNTNSLPGFTDVCSVVISPSTVPLIKLDFPDALLCKTTLNGKVSSVTYTVGANDGTAVWHIGNSTPHTNSKTFTYNQPGGPGGGDFHVTITTPEGCVYTDDFTITANPLSAAISYSHPPGTCNYLLSALNVIPNANDVSYLWQIIDNGGTDLLAGLTAINTLQSLTYVHSGGARPGCTIRLTITDINGCTMVYEKPNKNIQACNSGNKIMTRSSVEEELPESAKFSISPNPFTSFFVVDYDLTQYENAELRVTDMTNKIVFKKEMDVLESETKIDLEHVENGVYLVQIYSQGNLIESQRIVKMN